MSNPVQPAGQRMSLADRAAVSCQHQKRGLKSVLGVLLVLQNAAARSQYHRAVPINQLGKRRLIAPGDESIQQLVVSEPPR
jgi:hypothetical protein